MGSINLATEVPAKSAAHHQVCHEVFASGKARGIYAARNTVGQRLGQRTGVFMGDHTGYGKTGRGMKRGKRISALKKTSSAISNEGAVASRRVLDNLSIEGGIDCGFAAKQSGFTLLIVVAEVTPQKHARARGSESSESSIGCSGPARNRIRIARCVLLDCCVTCQQNGTGQG